MNHNTFFNNLPVYYINVDKDIDRNINMIKNMEDNFIKDYKRVSGVVLQKPIKNGYNMTNSEIGCTLSHFKALEEFYNSGLDFAMISEDDSDFNNSGKILFNFMDIVNKIKKESVCIQTASSYRISYDQKFIINKKSFWNFGTISYIVSKKYAENLLKKYGTFDNLNWDKFNSEELKDPRGGVFDTKPVADVIVYSIKDVYTLPIFSFIDTTSTIQKEKEYYSQVRNAIKRFNDHWSNYEKIRIEDIWKR